MECSIHRSRNLHGRLVGSMKGAVNINTSTPTGRRAQNLSWRPALPPFETSEFNPLFGNSVPHHNVASSSETEKRSGGRCQSFSCVVWDKGGDSARGTDWGGAGTR